MPKQIPKNPNKLKSVLIVIHNMPINPKKISKKDNIAIFPIFMDDYYVLSDFLEISPFSFF